MEFGLRSQLLTCMCVQKLALLDAAHCSQYIIVHFVVNGRTDGERTNKHTSYRIHTVPQERCCKTISIRGSQVEYIFKMSALIVTKIYRKLVAYKSFYQSIHSQSSANGHFSKIIQRKVDTYLLFMTSWIHTLHRSLDTFFMTAHHHKLNISSYLLFVSLDTLLIPAFHHSMDTRFIPALCNNMYTRLIPAPRHNPDSLHIPALRHSLDTLQCEE